MLSGRLREKSRREFLKVSSLGVFGASLSGWMPVLADHAARSGTRPRRCILLSMDGGPSHKDTFDLKPGTEHAGEYRPIKTSADGVEVCEKFEKLAGWMHEGAVIRSMSTGEGAHGRAKYYLHTGYKEGVGGLTYPALGSVASKEIGDDSPMPNYVTIGGRSYGSGYLGPAHQPLGVRDPSRGVENLKATVQAGQFKGRVGLLDRMESAFNREYRVEAATAHRTNYDRAIRLMTSPQARAFDLSDEPAAVKDRYGKGKFAEGVLMARRLIEVGVPFVEVVLGGWDHHDSIYDKLGKLLPQVDSAVSALLADLKSRGLLDSTLVVWMGEFGRTPKINARNPAPGRDHYPKAWSLAMFGGGVKGGTVVGRTDREGADVEERPVSALDFMATACSLLGIDYTKEYDTPIGRPIRIVEKGGEPVRELIA